MRHFTTKIETFEECVIDLCFQLSYKTRLCIRISRLALFLSTHSRYIKLSTSFVRSLKANPRSRCERYFLCKCHCNFHLLS